MCLIALFSKVLFPLIDDTTCEAEMDNCSKRPWLKKIFYCLVSRAASAAKNKNGKPRLPFWIIKVNSTDFGQSLCSIYGDSLIESLQRNSFIFVLVTQSGKAFVDIE